MSKRSHSFDRVGTLVMNHGPRPPAAVAAARRGD
jgi:hypothetical protein